RRLDEFSVGGKFGHGPRFLSPKRRSQGRRALLHIHHGRTVVTHRHKGRADPHRDACAAHTALGRDDGNNASIALPPPHRVDEFSFTVRHFGRIRRDQSPADSAHEGTGRSRTGLWLDRRGQCRFINRRYWHGWWFIQVGCFLGARGGHARAELVDRRGGRFVVLVGLRNVRRKFVITLSQGARVSAYGREVRGRAIRAASI